MDPQVEERLEVLRKTNPEVDALLHQHRSLDEQVGDLTAKPHLTPEEDMELHRLKKEKLQLKDRIESFLHAQSA